MSEKSISPSNPEEIEANNDPQQPYEEQSNQLTTNTDPNECQGSVYDVQQGGYIWQKTSVIPCPHSTHSEQQPIGYLQQQPSNYQPLNYDNDKPNQTSPSKPYESEYPSKQVYSEPMYDSDQSYDQTVRSPMSMSDESESPSQPQPQDVPQYQQKPIQTQSDWTSPSKPSQESEQSYPSPSNQWSPTDSESESQSQPQDVPHSQYQQKPIHTQPDWTSPSKPSQRSQTSPANQWIPTESDSPSHSPINSSDSQSPTQWSPLNNNENFGDTEKPSEMSPKEYPTEDMYTTDPNHNNMDPTFNDPNMSRSPQDFDSSQSQRKPIKYIAYDICITPDFADIFAGKGDNSGTNDQRDQFRPFDEQNRNQEQKPYKTFKAKDIKPNEPPVHRDWRNQSPMRDQTPLEDQRQQTIGYPRQRVSNYPQMDSDYDELNQTEGNAYQTPLEEQRQQPYGYPQQQQSNYQPLDYDYNKSNQTQPSNESEYPRQPYNYLQSYEPQNDSDESPKDQSYESEQSSPQTRMNGSETPSNKYDEPKGWPQYGSNSDSQQPYDEQSNQLMTNSDPNQCQGSVYDVQQGGYIWQKTYVIPCPHSTHSEQQPIGYPQQRQQQPSNYQPLNYDNDEPSQQESDSPSHSPINSNDSQSPTQSSPLNNENFDDSESPSEVSPEEYPAEDKYTTDPNNNYMDPNFNDQNLQTPSQEQKQQLNGYPQQQQSNYQPLDYDYNKPNQTQPSKSYESEYPPKQSHIYQTPMKERTQQPDNYYSPQETKSPVENQNETRDPNTRTYGTQTQPNNSEFPSENTNTSETQSPNSLQSYEPQHDSDQSPIEKRTKQPYNYPSNKYDENKFMREPKQHPKNESKSQPFNENYSPISSETQSPVSQTSGPNNDEQPFNDDRNRRTQPVLQEWNEQPLSHSPQENQRDVDSQTPTYEPKVSTKQTPIKDHSSKFYEPRYSPKQEYDEQSPDNTDITDKTPLEDQNESPMFYAPQESQRTAEYPSQTQPMIRRPVETEAQTNDSQNPSFDSPKQTETFEPQSESLVSSAPKYKQQKSLPQREYFSNASETPNSRNDGQKVYPKPGDNRTFEAYGQPYILSHGSKAVPYNKENYRPKNPQVYEPSDYESNDSDSQPERSPLVSSDSSISRQPALNEPRSSQQSSPQTSQDSPQSEPPMIESPETRSVGTQTGETKPLLRENIEDNLNAPQSDEQYVPNDMSSMSSDLSHESTPMIESPKTRSIGTQTEPLGARTFESQQNSPTDSTGEPVMLEPQSEPQTDFEESSAESAVPERYEISPTIKKLRDGLADNVQHVIYYRTGSDIKPIGVMNGRILSQNKSNSKLNYRSGNGSIRSYLVDNTSEEAVKAANSVKSSPNLVRILTSGSGVASIQGQTGGGFTFSGDTTLTLSGRLVIRTHTGEEKQVSPQSSSFTISKGIVFVIVCDNEIIVLDSQENHFKIN